MSRRAEAIAAFVIAAGLHPAAATAHGAQATARPTRAVAVEARYDDGAPMAGAQVAVFSPHDPRRPWLRGVTDEAGRFLFAPDDRPGRWAVQVRQAGHGALTTVLLGEADAPAEGPAAAASATQRAIMAAAVIWGFVGTALYFRRGRA